MNLADMHDYQYAWAGLFLICEGVLVYGALHFILNPEIRNNLAAKRFNERIRYTATALNTAAVGMIAGSVIIPSINEDHLGWWSALWACAGFVLHIVGHLLLGLIKKEEGYE
ncbi:MAG: hypothetical protein CL534_03765 [Ahrensia sp.]|nr:hypothetical protein [Ahrensia sp.]